MNMLYNVTQVTKYFKRCSLNKYGKMIRGKQATLHFKRCGLKEYGKMKYLYYVIHTENKQRCFFQTFWFVLFVKRGL
jgi:hypothetical protein